MSAAGSAILRGLRQCLGGLVDLFLPAVCAGCDGADAETGRLCEACERRLLSLVALPYCPRCGATLGPNIPVRDDGCGACRTVLPRFSRVVRLGPYADPLRHVILAMKYHRREAMRRRLGQMLAQAVAAQCSEETFDLTMPVPMHWRRRIQRGYDHARMLAQSIARPLRLAVGDELVRARHTPPQVGLSRTGREDNVRGAFEVSRPAAVEGANILLVDDVTTTGATASEAARALLKAGALRVTLAVIAKSEPPTAYADAARR